MRKKSKRKKSLFFFSIKSNYFAIGYFFFSLILHQYASIFRQFLQRYTHTHLHKEKEDGKFSAIFNLQVEHNLIFLLFLVVNCCCMMMKCKDFEFYCMCESVCVICIYALLTNVYIACLCRCLFRIRTWLLSGTMSRWISILFTIYFSFSFSE